MKTNTTYLLLGANLGDRPLMFDKATIEIEAKIGVVISKSSIYETAAWGKTDQPAFLNQVLKIQTKLHPIDVLDRVLKIEQHLGRKRAEHWGARSIDIDILYYADVVMTMINLVIPHPHLHQRRFTLVPLVEIAADYQHPKLKQSNSELLEKCLDLGQVSEYLPPITQ